MGHPSSWPCRLERETFCCDNQSGVKDVSWVLRKMDNQQVRDANMLAYLSNEFVCTVELVLAHGCKGRELLLVVGAADSPRNNGCFILCK